MVLPDTDQSVVVSAFSLVKIWMLLHHRTCIMTSMYVACCTTCCSQMLLIMPFTVRRCTCSTACQWTWAWYPWPSFGQSQLQQQTIQNPVQFGAQMLSITALGSLSGLSTRIAIPISLCEVVLDGSTERHHCLTLACTLWTTSNASVM